MHNRLSVVNPQIFRVSAAHDASGEQPSFEWEAEYGPASPDGALGGYRPVWTELRIQGKVAVVEVVVGSFVGAADEGDQVPEDDFAAVLASSNALETIYDFSRPIARQLLGLTNMTVDVPAKAPSASVQRFSFYDELLKSGQST